MINRFKWVGLIFLILILLPNISTGNVNPKNDGLYQNKTIVLDKQDVYNIGLTDIKKDDEINIKINAESPINLYIINETEYAKRHIYGFNNSSYKSKNVRELSFNWTVPDSEDYMMVLENPHNFSVEIEYVFQTKNRSIDLTGIFEEMICCCSIILGIGLVIIILIVMYVKS